jgi:hypothetical protein
MNFSIFDSGNLVASYSDKQWALDALARLVDDDPGTADAVVLVAFDESGTQVGDPVLGSSVQSEQPV